MTEQELQPTEISEEELERRGKQAWKVIGLMFMASIALGGFAYYQLTTSAQYIERSLKAFGPTGKQKDPVQCVETAMTWFKTCKALDILCMDALPKMIGACLKAQDRKPVCASYKLHQLRAKYTFAMCKGKKMKVGKKLNRKMKKACSRGYGTIWGYCNTLLGKKIEANAVKPSS